MSFWNFQVYTIDGKIEVPQSLQYRIIKWYYTNLHHPEVMRTIYSINQTFNWKGLRPQVEVHIKSFVPYQFHKTTGKPNYDLLPAVPELHDKEPFEKVHVDCARLLTIKDQNIFIIGNIEYKAHIMSIVDACTNLWNSHSFKQQTPKLCYSVWYQLALLLPKTLWSGPWQCERIHGQGMSGVICQLWH